MKIALGSAVTLGVLLALACNTSGLSNAPRATFSQLACLDRNNDRRINAADAVDIKSVPDFNGDRVRDGDDAAFLFGLDIPLNPEGEWCAEAQRRAPEYLVAHGFLRPSDVDCDNGAAILIVGVGGGVVNLEQKEDAAGVRSIVDELLDELDDEDVQAIAVIAGPAIVGAANGNGGMEEWLAHAVQVYLERYDCMRAVVLGHSHGAITAEVVAARLEGKYGERIAYVVGIDRFEGLYTGDLATRPAQTPFLNIFIEGSAAPYDAPNVENYDATHEEGPRDGEEGDPMEPVTHTTIDNSKPVRERIVDAMIERVRASSAAR